MHNVWIVTNRDAVDQCIPFIQLIDKKCFSKKDSVIETDKKEVLKSSTILICCSLENSSRVIGYTLLSHTRQEGSLKISKIAVHPEFQNMGIGSSMIEKTLLLAKARRVSSVTLYVATFRTNAIKLYTKYGFINDQLLLNYYPISSNDAYCMKLNVAM